MPNLDWISLIIIDTAIMLIASILMIVINHIAINKRIKNLEVSKDENK